MVSHIGLRKSTKAHWAHFRLKKKHFSYNCPNLLRINAKLSRINEKLLVYIYMCKKRIFTSFLQNHRTKISQNLHKAFRGKMNPSYSNEGQRFHSRGDNNSKISKNILIIVNFLFLKKKIDGDVTVAVEGLQILTCALHSWPLSSEASLACHTFCDTGHPFIMVISKDPCHSHLLWRV